MKKLLISLVATALVFGGVTTTSGWEEITPEDAQDMIDSNLNAYLLDVRTVAEYKFVGHPNAPEDRIKNIPYWKFEFDRASDEYLFYYVEDGNLVANINNFFDEEVYRHFDPATDTIIVVCKTGGRAGFAAEDLEERSEPAGNRLEKLGFFSIYRMTGGFKAWQDLGLPVSSGYEGIWKPSDFRGRSLKKK